MDTEQIVNDSNKVLRHLRDNAESEWKDVIATVLTESEYETNLTTIDRAMKAQGLEDIYGAMAIGTGTLADEVGLDVADGRLAIKILKDAGRIVQCGRGRGKAVVVLHTVMIDIATVKDIVKDEPKTETPKKQVAVEGPTTPVTPVVTTTEKTETNIVDVLNNATTQVSSLQDRVNELETLVEQKDGEISELKSELEKAQQKLDTKQLTSWT